MRTTLNVNPVFIGFTFRLLKWRIYRHGGKQLYILVKDAAASDFSCVRMEARQGRDSLLALFTFNRVPIGTTLASQYYLIFHQR